jgi:hypothetical protein
MDVSHNKMQSLRNSPGNNMLPMLHYVFPDGMLSITVWISQIWHFLDQAGKELKDFPSHVWSMLWYQRIQSSIDIFVSIAMRYRMDGQGFKYATIQYCFSVVTQLNKAIRKYTAYRYKHDACIPGNTDIGNCCSGCVKSPHANKTHTKTWNAEFGKSLLHML